MTSTRRTHRQVVAQQRLQLKLLRIELDELQDELTDMHPDDPDIVDVEEQLEECGGRYDALLADMTTSQTPRRPIVRAACMAALLFATVVAGLVLGVVYLSS